ncbi:hypothetical protein DFH09DRAFT_1459236, partial [Mycena vulgaris]
VGRFPVGRYRRRSTHLWIAPARAPFSSLRDGSRPLGHDGARYPRRRYTPIYFSLSHGATYPQRDESHLRASFPRTAHPFCGCSSCAALSGHRKQPIILRPTRFGRRAVDYSPCDSVASPPRLFMLGLSEQPRSPPPLHSERRWLVDSTSAPRADDSRLGDPRHVPPPRLSPLSARFSGIEPR